MHSPSGLQLYQQLLRDSANGYLTTYYPMGSTGVLAAAGRDLIAHPAWSTEVDQDHSVVAVWPPNNASPYAIYGTPWYWDDYVGEGFPASWNSYVRFLAIDLVGRVWVNVNTSSDSYQLRAYTAQNTFQSHYNISNAGALGVVVLQSDGSKEIGYVKNFDTGLVGAFVGKPAAADLVNFYPLALNRRGDLVAEDEPWGDNPDEPSEDINLATYYSQLEHRVMDAEHAGVEILQKQKGALVVRAFVKLADGTRHDLPDDADAITGFDDSANVYGREIDGRPVIWVADPSAWGLAPGTPPYTAVPYAKPILPAGHESLTTVRPGPPIRPELIRAARATASGPSSASGKVILPVCLALDANRDGTIQTISDGEADATSAKRPFRFWVNDDDDVDTNDPDDSEKAPIEAADWTDGQIDGIRDLEDFARLTIHLGGLHEAMLNGTMKVGLKWKNVTSGAPSIKVWRNRSPNGDTEYLYDETIARQHLVLGTPGHVQGTTPYLIPQAFWQQSGFSATNPYGYLLFEGCTEGKGELAITIHKADGTEIGEGPGVWIDLKNIKHMYQRVKALADGGDEIPKPPDFTGPNDNNIPNPVMSWIDDSGAHPFQAPAGETKTCIVSVHGWNQTYERSTMYAESAFKRLWHRGYKGRFVRFRWPTYTGIFTYNNSEYKAWKCGESLQQYLDSIPRGSGGFTVNMIAHSMGNIVAGEALRRGAAVSNYALWNAAVPSICYDDRIALDQGWGYTHPNDDPDAYTRDLAYRNRFAGVSGRLINFFLEDDFALGQWKTNNAISKPERWTSVFIAGYGYDRATISGRKLYLEFWTALGRYLVDPHEAMSYAVKSPTLAVGADSDLVDSGGATYGSISAEIDMGAAYSFDSAHSAQFLFPIQKTKALYDQTLIEFQLTPLP